MQIKLPFKFKISDNIRHITSWVVLVAFLGVGVLSYLGRYAYAEDGHNWYLFLYILCCGALFIGIRRLSILLIVVSVLLAFGVQGFANQKFNWRQGYVASAIGGHPFPLAEMIDSYPTYEQYVFRFLGKPDWVRLNRDCIEPVLNDQPVDARCNSTDGIYTYYHIDIIREMEIYANRMRRTAKMLDEGQMTRRQEYLVCIQEKTCATIPLLPKGVDAEQIDPMSQDYLDIRQAFWSLVNDQRLSPETCALTPICNAMVKLGLVQPNSLPF